MPIPHWLTSYIPTVDWQRVTHWSLLLAITLATHTTFAAEREQAKRLHDRLAGTPPSETVLNNMATLINNNQALAAANIAIEDPAFYNVTLKNWIAPWTNRDQNVFVPLNDFTATVIGLIRDDVDFRNVLSADVLYVGNSGLGLTAYANNNNAHYQALEDGGFNLKTSLQATTQSAVTGLPADATAGIMTTRAAARAFFIDGTNRAMLRFTLMNFLCTDLESLSDTSRPTDRIRQDVSRSPGGDSRLFLNNCVGCHSGMDPLAQAFAYYDFTYDEDNDTDAVNGSLLYHANIVDGKYQINTTTFPYGFVTPDHQWTNYWRQGKNQLLGWDTALPSSGQGAKSLGQELSHSQQFASCQATKVFKAMCLRPPVDAADRSAITSLVSTFSSNGYTLKPLFAQAAVYCMGD
jgi:hypothetical protein